MCLVGRVCVSDSDVYAENGLAVLGRGADMLVPVNPDYINKIGRENDHERPGSAGTRE